MKLKNEFTRETKLLYLYEYACWICGSNGGGSMEIHHITGRDSNSPFNSCLLCRDCHAVMKHNQEEERFLFGKTFKWLHWLGYKITGDDEMFMRNKYKRLFSEELRLWISRNLQTKK